MKLTKAPSHKTTDASLVSQLGFHNTYLTLRPVYVRPKRTDTRTPHMRGQPLFPNHTHTTSDGHLPCERCFRLGQTCTPQAVAPRRGRGRAAATTRNSNADATTAHMTPTAIAQQGALATAAASASLQQTAVVELAFQKASPRPLVELLCKAFLREATAPGARREVAVDVM
jgi:hypothetical protein